MLDEGGWEERERGGGVVLKIVKEGRWRERKGGRF